MIKLNFLYKVLCSCDVIFKIKYPRAESEDLHSYPLPLPVLAQCSLSVPPENVTKPNVFRGIKMEHWAKMG